MNKIIKSIELDIANIIDPMMKALGPLAPLVPVASDYLSGALNKCIDNFFDNITNSKND